MIDAFVYRTLKDDDTLRGLLGATEDNSRIDPRATNMKTRVIVYKVVPGSFDGHTHVDRIEIRIIERNDDQLRDMQERVLALLVMREGEPPKLFEVEEMGAIAIYSCKLNGGGELEDEYDTHRMLYLDVIWRNLYG